MLLGQSAVVDLSPEPILAAVENYRGTMIDLDSGVSVPPEALARARQTLERLLAGCGWGPGDRAVVAVGNGPLFVTALTALLARGIAPLLLHVKTPAAELRRTAKKYSAGIVLCDGCSESDLASADLTYQLLRCADWGALLAVNLAETVNAAPASAAKLTAVPLHPTSGSTGTPKMAIRPGRVAVAEAEHYIQTTGIDQRDTILVVPPMSHAYCYGMGVMVPLLSGANVASIRSFSVTQVRNALAHAGITVLPAAPAMLSSLMFGAASNLFDGVRDVFSAGAPLSEKIGASFNKRFASTVRPLYGTTETGGIAISPPAEEAVMGACVGPAMRGVEAEVRGRIGADDDKVGMLFVRSESMMVGYLDSEGHVTTPIRDGWFETGDIAWLDTLGHIHLKGRQSEVINVAGMKVIPSEVEDVISEVPGVLEVKVYGREHRSGSSTVRAAVVLNDATSENEIRAYCEKNLVYYKRPDKVIIIDALPRSPAGKIVRDMLP